MSKKRSSWRKTLSARGFPDVILDLWNTEGITELLPLQVKALEDDSFFTRNSLVVGPTSCGKTFIGEILCIHHALKRRSSIFLVPFKALAEEKLQDFRRKYAREGVGVRVIISTGDRRNDDRMLVDGDYDIAVLTNEKLSSLIVTHPGILSNVGALIVDEVQMIRDEARGAELESLLTRARQIAPEIQVVGLSAVVSDLNGFDQWLNAQLITDEHRPVPLQEGVIAPNGSFTFVEWGADSRTMGNTQLPKIAGTSHDELATSLAAILLQDPGEQVLVFSSTVRATETLAKNIARQVSSLPPAKKVLERLAEYEQTESIVALTETLSHCVAFHNADLILDERQAVEEGFRRQEVRCIVSTSTLSLGVNLPASAVVIVEATKWTHVTGQWNQVPITVGEYRNMSGRAGRFGLNADAFGRSFLVCTSPFDQSTAMNAYVEGTPEPLASLLFSKPLPDLLLKTLGSRLCDSIDSFFQFLLNTYFAHVVGKKKMRDAGLRASIERASDELIGASLVDTDGSDRLVATALGSACASSGLQAKSYQTIIDSLNNPRPSVTDVAFIASNLDDSGPDAANLRLATPEYRGRGPVFIRSIRDAEQMTPGPLTEAILDSLATGSLPDYETVKKLKFQAVALAFVNGIASREIENTLGASAGRARAVGALCSWISDTASKIAWIKHDVEQAKQYEIISERFLHGCSESALLLASVSHNLHRAERETLVAAGYDSLQVIIDSPAIEIAQTARISRLRIEQLQKGIINLIGESLTLERTQLVRLRSIDVSTSGIEAIYTLKGTRLEQALENLLVPPFCQLKVVRISNQREGEADLRIILSDGNNGIAQVTAKDRPTDKVGIVKAMSVLSQSPELKPQVFVCIGRPDFLPEAKEKSAEHARNNVNLKLIPVSVLAEMYVRFCENRLSADRIQSILETDTGYIDLGRI